MESRRTLKACSLEACPAAVQRDCVRWLEEVSDQLPTVVFEAVTATGAAQRVTVTAGDRVVTQELDGRPIEMDPGYYEFRFDLDRQPARLVAVLLKQGEKNRLVSVDFRDEASVASSPAAPNAAEPMQPPAAATAEPHGSAAARPLPIAVYVLGGVAIASATAATVLGLNTRSKEASALTECAPKCSDQRIDSIKRSALFTDAALGTATLSAIIALTLYLVRPEASSSKNDQERLGGASRIRWRSSWNGLEAAF